MGSLPTTAYPNALETDAFDAPNLVHPSQVLVAFYMGVLAGTFRIMFPGDDPYLLERDESPFRLPPGFDRKTGCELSRLIAHHKDDAVLGRITQSDLLFRAALTHCLRQGKRHWAFAIREDLCRRLEGRAWVFHRFAGPCQYHGITAVAVTVDLLECQNALPPPVFPSP
jgi:N-acyl-L-homoserine lactone synthetase